MPPSLPRPAPQENLRLCIQLAFDRLTELEPAMIAHRAGARLVDKGRAALEVLSRELLVDFDRRCLTDRAGSAVPDPIAAPVARYLAVSAGLEDPHELESAPEIGFADDPSARGYFGPFRGRVIAPLLARFGRDAEGLSRAARELGGEHTTIEGAPGHAFRLRVFPRVSLAVILYPGDEELPAECQFLFPRGLFRAFAVDDIVAMAELVSKALRGKLWPAGFVS